MKDIRIAVVGFASTVRCAAVSNARVERCVLRCPLSVSKTNYSSFFFVFNPLDIAQQLQISLMRYDHARLGVNRSLDHQTVVPFRCYSVDVNGGTIG